MAVMALAWEQWAALAYAPAAWGGRSGAQGCSCCTSPSPDALGWGRWLAGHWHPRHGVPGCLLPGHGADTPCRDLQDGTSLLVRRVAPGQAGLSGRSCFEAGREHGFIWVYY